MRKAIVLAVIAMLVLLAACGGNQMKAKPLSARTPTAAAVNQATAAPAPEANPAPAPEVTAAEAIKELQQQIQNTPTTKSPTVVNTGIPPAPSGLTGRDAMLARMKLYMNQSVGVKGVTGVITDLPDYTDTSNLPKEYQQGGQYDN
jgi:hypothetical protein